MLFANYHTHTMRCNHAIGSDREFVEAAIRGGMKVLGFSDHCPWIFPDGHSSSTRMIAADVDDYFFSLQSLKEEYAKDITIYIGFESEYIPELMPAQDELLRQYPLDYMILGEHFLTREPSPYTGSPTDDEQALVKYVDLIIEGLESGRYIYVAHPDLFFFTGSRKAYDVNMTRLCKYCKEHDIPLEINMLGATTGRNYPCDRFMRIAGKIGNTAIIGVDAHSPDRLEDAAGIDTCRKIAENHGLHLIDRLPGLQ